ncbi:hypothetical protein GCM10023205_67380 [Yinghuangia aomiensis]|uniref:Uncharacterized protein n=1 Tax=Yinghuangia aomiensis TaxID=676205 RepID=A0ABP9I3N7_9ACTN
MSAAAPHGARFAFYIGGGLPPVDSCVAPVFGFLAEVVPDGGWPPVVVLVGQALDKHCQFFRGQHRIVRNWPKCGEVSKDPCGQVPMPARERLDAERQCCWLGRDDVGTEPRLAVDVVEGRVQGLVGAARRFHCPLAGVAVAASRDQVERNHRQCRIERLGQMVVHRLDAALAAQRAALVRRGSHDRLIHRAPRCVRGQHAVVVRLGLLVFQHTVQDARRLVEEMQVPSTGRRRVCGSGHRVGGGGCAPTGSA